MECDAILFDLDGVLIDSTRCIARHWTAWAARHNLDLNMIMQAAHGVRTIDTVRAVAPQLDAEQEAAYLSAREAADMDGIVAVEGAADLLSAIPDHAWAVVTSGTSELARARLMHASLPIPNVLVTAGDVTQGKPAPEPYLLAAERLGIPPDQCIVIEDAPAGVEAARRAGMKSIGIAGTHNRRELLDKGADLVVDRLRQLGIHITPGQHRLIIKTS
jgi:sugar-phosphatase